MPRIRKPKHLLSEETLFRIMDNGDTLIQLNSIEGISVGMNYKGIKILGFVCLSNYSKEVIHVVLEGTGRYGDGGFVEGFDFIRSQICQG